MLFGSPWQKLRWASCGQRGPLPGQGRASAGGRAPAMGAQGGPCVRSSAWLRDPRNCSLRQSSTQRFPSKNAGLGCHFLLQGIFLARGSNPHPSCLPIGRRLLFHWAAGQPGAQRPCRLGFSLQPAPPSVADWLYWLLRSQGKGAAATSVTMSYILVSGRTWNWHALQFQFPLEGILEPMLTPGPEDRSR